MSIKAVIFDLGGVLVRTENRAPREQLAARLGVSSSELSQLVFDSQSARLATLGVISTQDHWENIRQALNLSPVEFHEVPRYFWGGDVVDYELVGFLRALGRRYKTALLSNAWDNLRKVLVNGWKIADAFEELIISAEVGLAKPDERIYQLALDRLGVAPSKAVFVDDFPENVEAARIMGIHAIEFRHPNQLQVELKQLLKSRKIN